MNDKPVSESRAAYLAAVRRRTRWVHTCQVGFLVLFVALWEGLTRVGVLDAFIVSSPSRIAGTLLDMSQNNLALHIGVTLYAEDMYAHYKAGLPIEQIVQEALNAMREYSKGMPRDFDCSKVFCEENIIPALIPSRGHEALLKNVPHIPFQDMQITFKFLFDGFGGPTITDVTNSFMQEHGYSEQELLDIAKNNAGFKDRICITPMENHSFKGPLSKREDDLSYINDLIDRAVIITNPDIYYGAAAILDTEVLSKVSEAFGENLHILPSDIHSCLLIAESEKSKSEVQELLDISNIFFTRPEERLSNSAYYFDNKTKQITKPPQSQEKTEQQRTSQTEPKR